jgi:hypothetical protein
MMLLNKTRMEISGRSLRVAEFQRMESAELSFGGEAAESGRPGGGSAKEPG